MKTSERDTIAAFYTATEFRHFNEWMVGNSYLGITSGRPSKSNNRRPPSLVAIMRTLFGHWGGDVGVSSDLLPASTLFHPDPCKAEMLDLSGVRHFASLHHCLTSRHDRRIPIDPNVLDAPRVGRDHQQAGIDHPQNLLLGYELV